MKKIKIKRKETPGLGRTAIGSSLLSHPAESELVVAFSTCTGRGGDMPMLLQTKDGKKKKRKKYVVKKKKRKK